LTSTKELTVPDDDRTSEPLTLYLAYDFLPVQQQATILYAVGATYGTISESVSLPELLRSEPGFPYWGLPIPELPAGTFPRFGPPLCIDSANTGESIKYKFDIEKRFWPRLRFNKGDLIVMIPRWTAVAVLTGAVLVAGLAGYNQVLDTQIKHLEREKLREEIQRLHEPLQQHPDPRIEMYAQLFRYEVKLPNIRAVEVNGVDARTWGR